MAKSKQDNEARDEIQNAAARSPATEMSAEADATEQDNRATADAAPALDDWASALAEQAAATPAGKPAAQEDANTPFPDRADRIFKPLTDSNASGNSEIDMIMDIPVQLSVELGRTRLTIKNILQLGQGSVVELDGLAGEPMDIFVNGYLIAQGEVVVVDEKYGIRVTDIVTPSDRLSRLNGRR